jgi:hypothetical protein
MVQQRRTSPDISQKQLDFQIFVRCVIGLVGIGIGHDIGGHAKDFGEHIIRQTAACARIDQRGLAARLRDGPLNDLAPRIIKRGIRRQHPAVKGDLNLEGVTGNMGAHAVHHLIRGHRLDQPDVAFGHRITGQNRFGPRPLIAPIQAVDGQRGV